MDSMSDGQEWKTQHSAKQNGSLVIAALALSILSTLFCLCILVILATKSSGLNTEERSKICEECMTKLNLRFGINDVSRKKFIEAVLKKQNISRAKRHVQNNVDLELDVLHKAHHSGKRNKTCITNKTVICGKCPRGPPGPRGIKGEKGDRGPRGPPAPPLSKPIIGSALQNIRATESATATFSCLSTGNPEPKISWKINGKLITSSSSTRYKIIGESGLEITNVSRNDAGTVECQATSIMGEDRRLASLTVYYPPSAVVFPKRARVFANVDEFKANCQADGFPKPNITWQKNGGQRYPNGASLALRRPKKTDSGEYTCTAENMIGRSSASLVLFVETRYVIPKSGSETIKKTWPDARAYCVSLGGDLLSIDDFAEHQRVLNFIESSGVDELLWIGFNDRKTEGKFEWSDGNPSQFTDWYNNEPNGGRSENCAHLFPKVIKRKWNDCNCLSRWGIICKIK